MKIEIKPQFGPQTDFLKTKADIALFGGSAGGGKTYALLLEFLRHYNNSQFNAIIFRRNSTHIRNPGGLWDTSLFLYHQLKGVPKQAFLEWEFPSGARVKMAHLENKDTVYSYQGAQIPLIMWDELVHFEESQFWYMLSRLRSTSGVPGYIRATCNPDSDSWVRKLVDWYIDAEGYAIKERAGVIRWFIRMDDEIVWADSREELITKYGETQIPKSFTFIPSSIYDNKILMEKDPSYFSNLMALSRVERMRLLGGNWNVRPSAGMYFRREWFEMVDIPTANIIRTVRAWDRAATRMSDENKDPDWTVGVKLHKMNGGLWVVANVIRFRGTPLEVERRVKNTATQDTPGTSIVIEQEPGSAGVSDIDNYMRVLAGYHVQVQKSSKDKVTRALPLSAQCEAGNVKVSRGEWNEAFFNELENFPEGAHDDQVDAASCGFNELATGGASILDVLGALGGIYGR